MSYIGENGAGFVCAGRDGKIYIKVLGEEQEEIPLSLFKTYKFGEEYQISRVAYENGLESFKFGDETKNTLWLNQENIFIVNEEQVKNIYNKLKGLTINGFEGTTIINPAWDIGDIIFISGKPVIYQGEMTFNKRFLCDIKSKLSIKQRQETTTKKPSQKLINRRVKAQINEAEGKITQLVQEQTEASNKLSQQEQTIDGMKDTISSVETKVETVEKSTIVNVDVEYAIGTSTTVAPTEDWSTKAPEWENNKYMWQRTVTTYADGKQEISDATCIAGAKGDTGKNGTNGTNGANGEDGIGIKEIEEQYYLSTSDENRTGGSWKSTQDTWSSGKFIWIRSKITWTDDNITYTTPVLATGLNNANQTANTANTNAQDAQKKANEVSGQVKTTTEKVASLEETVEGFNQKVSEVEEKVTIVETTANTAKTTAEGVNENLTTNYYNKTQTDSQIKQSASSVTSEVNKTVSTAKQEAIDSANTSTDDKLKKYTEIEKLGTAIEQNYEHVKIAWNQISEFIQMMIINGNASFAILDENKNIIMALDKTGQDFYESGQKFGEMGTEKNENDKFIAFSVDGEYDNDVSNGMAWGVKTKSDNKFHPIFYISEFYIPPKNSEGVMGDLILTSGNFIVGDERCAIKVGRNIYKWKRVRWNIFWKSRYRGNFIANIKRKCSRLS